MKLLMFIPLFLASCAQYKVDPPPTRAVTFTTFGTDFDAAEVSADKLVIIRQNQSKVIMSAIRTAGTTASTWIVNDMLKYVRGQEASEVTNGQNADVAKESMREVTKQTQIKSDAAVETIKTITP